MVWHRFTSPTSPMNKENVSIIMSTIPPTSMNERNKLFLPLVLTMKRTKDALKNGKDQRLSTIFEQHMRSNSGTNKNGKDAKKKKKRCEYGGNQSIWEQPVIIENFSRQNKSIKKKINKNQVFTFLLEHLDNILPKLLNVNLRTKMSLGTVSKYLLKYFNHNAIWVSFWWSVIWCKQLLTTKEKVSRTHR